MPEHSPPRHLAIQINQALHELMAKYPETLLFGEDVAQKGGVYTVTKGLQKTFKGARVFNTLLDETMILGLAQGYANMGMLPLPEIQYLAYLHNAADQIRGEAPRCSSSQQASTAPILVRSPGWAISRLRQALPQHNSIAALRVFPVSWSAAEQGDDATYCAPGGAGQVDGRVCSWNPSRCT